MLPCPFEVQVRERTLTEILRCVSYGGARVLLLRWEAASSPGGTSACFPRASDRGAARWCARMWDDRRLSPISDLTQMPEWRTLWGMKVKTSITLPADLLTAIDNQADSFKNRSDFIEAAVRTFLAQRQREAREARDLAIINERADRLNDEAAEVLEYQVIP